VVHERKIRKIQKTFDVANGFCFEAISFFKMMIVDENVKL